MSTRFSLTMEMSRLTRDVTTEPVSRDQILRREREQGNIHFPCSDDHEQGWQPYPVDPYSCYMCDHTLTLIAMQGHQTKQRQNKQDKEHKAHDTMSLLDDAYYRKI